MMPTRLISSKLPYLNGSGLSNWIDAQRSVAPLSRTELPENLEAAALDQVVVTVVLQWQGALLRAAVWELPAAKPSVSSSFDLRQWLESTSEPLLVSCFPLP